MRRLERAVEWFGVACLGVLLALMVAQVIMRYGFGYSHFFTEEIGRYLLVWASLAGTALAVRQRAHIRIEFLVDRLPDRARRWWFWLIDFWCLVLFSIIAAGGIEMAYFARSQTSQGMQIPLVWPYSSLPLFFILAAVFALANLLSRRDSG